MKKKPKTSKKSMALRYRSPASSLLFDFGAADLPLSRPAATVRCCSRRSSSSSIPKLEPFSRSRIERLVKDPPFLQKSENDLTDYCSTLEGDDAYRCWRAYFELKDLEEEMPREDVERLVRQAGGVKSLIGCLHGIAAMQKKGKELAKPRVTASEVTKWEMHCPRPDGLPKTEEELKEEERARMPDSPFTRLLRSKGRLPAWYSRAPDHETY